MLGPHSAPWAIAFTNACGANPGEFRAVEFYSSHEALLLDYEQALTGPTRAPAASP